MEHQALYDKCRLTLPPGKNEAPHAHPFQRGPPSFRIGMCQMDLSPKSRAIYTLHDITTQSPL